MRLGKADKLALVAFLIGLAVIVGAFVFLSRVKSIDAQGYHYY